MITRLNPLCQSDGDTNVKYTQGLPPGALLSLLLSPINYDYCNPPQCIQLNSYESIFGSGFT